MASVPFSFECDKESGFVMDPNEHKRIGYITDFRGLSMSVPLAQDLTISLPHTNQPPTHTPIVSPKSFDPVHNTTKVVGVLEKFEWKGSVGTPLKLEFYVSQENATQIKAHQATLNATRIDQLGWWILDYDQETQQWYEQSFPQSPKGVSGQLNNRGNPGLNVDPTPVPVKDGIDVMVYKVSIEVVPGANQQHALSFANSSTQRVTKQWGLVVGNLAKPAIE